MQGVSEAVAQGVREDEVCYRAAFSKHELRRVLAMYPAHEGECNACSTIYYKCCNV